MESNQMLFICIRIIYFNAISAADVHCNKPLMITKSCLGCFSAPNQSEQGQKDKEND